MTAEQQVHIAREREISGPSQSPTEGASEEELQVLAHSQLLTGLDHRQREEFMTHASLVEFDAPGAIVVREGGEAENFYMILAGEAEVFKREVESEREFPVATLRPGDHFGETALFRKTKRTATIRALTPMTLLMVKTRAIRDAPAEHSWLAGFLLNLAREESSRLNRLTNTTVESLRAEYDGTTRVLALNQFLIYAILGLAFYAVSMSFTARLGYDISRMVGNGLYVVFAGVLIWVMKRSPYPVSFFGVRVADDLRSELLDAAAVTALLIAMLTGFKYLLIQSSPQLAEFALFEHGAFGFMEIAFTVGYVVFIPLQELCVRGALQSWLEEFFTGHRRQLLLSVLLSNALFAAMYSHVSPYHVIVLFVAGVAWGLLYVRHRSLLGISISHVLVGLWALRVLDLGELLRPL